MIMREIDIYDLKRMLPDEEHEKPTDEYFLTLAKYITTLPGEMKVLPELPRDVVNRLALNLVAYYQDIVADAGIWRSFVVMCRKLYHHPVPFYQADDNYIDFELNLIDVQFITWYSIESALGFDGLVSPYDADLLRFARKVEKLFRYLYDDVPMPENFGSLRELDLADREQVRDIFKASGWLFWNSYFLRPVSKYAYEPEISDDDELTIDETLTNEQRLRTTFEQPTGPLALYVNEWLQLMVDNKMPRQRKQDKGIHKYYQQFNNATGGKKLAFFGTYAELNAFLSEKMNWGNPAEGNLPQLKDYGNFVVFGNREKGIIIAPEVAQYVSHPDNPCYDTATAAAEAHLLLMQPGRCPIDLVKHLFENGYVPDASFPAGNNAHTLLHDNWDFIARLYLCKYYRAD